MVLIYTWLRASSLLFSFAITIRWRHKDTSSWVKKLIIKSWMELLHIQIILQLSYSSWSFTKKYSFVLCKATATMASPPNRSSIPSTLASAASYATFGCLACQRAHEWAENSLYWKKLSINLHLRQHIVEVHCCFIFMRLLSPWLLL